MAAKKAVAGGDAAAKKPGRKKSKKLVYIGTGVAVLSLIIWVGLQRPKGTIKFGICKTFVETTMTYPLYMHVSEARERPGDVYMEVTTTNEYGEYILSTVLCTFRPDPVTTWALSDVEINRQKEPQSVLNSFNASIPGILAHPPDLTLPAPLPDDLLSLQR